MKIINRTTKRRIGLLRHVRRCLSWIDPADLYGIERLVLQEEIGPPTKNSPDWHHKAHEEDHIVSGQYLFQSSGSPATIALYVRSLYLGIPRIFWLSPVITLHIARTLAHEVGHHIIAQRGYIFDRHEKTKDDFGEEMADRYAFFVAKRMLSRRHYRVAERITHDLAEWHYNIGTIEWRDSRFERAADYWHKAFLLDPNHPDAGYWYWQAKREVGKVVS